VELSERPGIVTQSSEPPLNPEGHHAALIAGFLGWTLDAFDFFLVIIALTAIAKDFGKSDAAIALSITLTLAFRPVGAFIFGLLADRYGRRLPLIIDLIFYSIVEILTGLAPNYTSFMILRALFGIGMGGEWGVGASLAMEKVPPKLRGVLSGLLQEGYAAGYLLAAVCYFFVFPRWGWRPMFFIGGLPALLAIFVRLRVKESEVWEKTRHRNWGQLGRGLVSHWKLFLYLVLLMMMMNFVSHGTQDMYPTLLKRAWGFSPKKVAAVTAFTMVGAIAGGIFFGLLSDRFGRRRSMIAALICALVVIPLFFGVSYLFSEQINTLWQWLRRAELAASVTLVIGAIAAIFVVRYVRKRRAAAERDIEDRSGSSPRSAPEREKSIA